MPIDSPTALRPDVTSGTVPSVVRRLGTPSSWIDIAFAAALLESLTLSLPFASINPSAARQFSLSLALVAMALISKPWQRNPRTINWAVAVCALLPFVGIISWASSLGTDQSFGNWAFWHPWILIAGFLPFAWAYGSTHWSSWRKILVTFAITAAAVQSLALIAIGIGWTSAVVSPYGDFNGLRTINATLAFLVLCGFVLVVTDNSGSRASMLLGLFLGVTVVLAQHRTVWVSLIVVSILLLVRSRGQWSWASLMPILGTALAFLAALLFPRLTGLSLLPVTDDATGSLGLPTAATSTHSLEWRIEMWTTRLQAPRPILNTLFGGVFSVTPVKVPGVGVMNPGNSAHSMPVDLHTMLGIFGLLLVGALFVAAAFLRKQRMDSIAIILWGLFAFGLFYDWPDLAWLLLGAALATRSSVIDPPPTPEGVRRDERGRTPSGDPTLRHSALRSALP